MPWVKGEREVPLSGKAVELTGSSERRTSTQDP